jgi:hypothetical protein
MQECRQTTVPESLEPDNMVLNVAVFPFATMFASLLNSPNLNKLENLVVNSSDRFGQFQSPDELLDEVNFGQCGIKTRMMTLSLILVNISWHQLSLQWIRLLFRKPVI